MSAQRLSFGFSCSVLLSGAAWAQGTDTCTTPTPIAGGGTFAVSTVGATDGTPIPTGCPTLHRDVWFAWTAPTTGAVLVQTCGGVSADSMLAAWPGSTCPATGTHLACNDDSCGLQSSITFSATAGNTYLLQVGAFGASTTYTGTFTISLPTPPSNDDCNSATAVSGAGPFAFDALGATIGVEGQTSAACGATTGIDHDVWFTWTATASGPMNVSTCGGSTAFDSKVAVYAGAGCPTASAIACNDNSCGTQSLAIFTAVLGSQYTIQIGSRPTTNGGPGSFTISTGSTGCAPGGTGPDVIIGRISDVMNVTAAGGIDAIALGTDACNIGTASVPWTTSSNHHPVIGGQLYKYKVANGYGRFEEIGQSWLKHGFAAANGSTCCTCQGGGGGLGVGCSDLYSSGLNGSQSGLGPRWQVNAVTGVFPYPPANPAWSGATPRRLELNLSDLEPTSATAAYVAECTYVTPDDAGAGNQNNNSSTIGVTVSGGPADYSFALAGTTTRMALALHSWPLFEPGVVLTNVQVPNDGLFVVGSHATNLGGGQWHYEYAVHNMNSDRNGGAFSVPIPAGVNVTNVGFHDLDYRNGDGPGSVNFSGADWTAALAGGFLTWSTQTEAQNPSGNALRWSTTYNFRFDADVGPMNGDVTIALWKAGTPASIAAAAEIPFGNVGQGFCFGDGTGTACPCGNASTPGANLGCLHSLGGAGALTGIGTPSVASDTLVLRGAGMPGDSTCLYFQGTQAENGGAGTVFGDGLRCAGGTVTRLSIRTNSAGASQYPGGGDPAVSLAGGVAAGDIRTYQVWYRNQAAFCTPSGFNLTNGLSLTWLP